MLRVSQRSEPELHSDAQWIDAKIRRTFMGRALRSPIDRARQRAGALARSVNNALRFRYGRRLGAERVQAKTARVSSGRHYWRGKKRRSIRPSCVTASGPLYPVWE